MIDLERQFEGEFPNHKIVNVNPQVALVRGAADKTDWIYPSSILQDLEMKIRACRPAGIAHSCDGLAFLHFVADCDEVL